jgi:UDP-N-acetylmuramate--alanine ligase
MRSLAHLLLEWGWKLSGSDQVLNGAAQLGPRGVTLHEGHESANVPDDAALVIRSDAVPGDNPELLRATQRGVPVYSYFDVLGLLGRDRTTLAVAGTHGKSSTTAMAAEILIRTGLDPTVVYGAVPTDRSSGGRNGQGQLMLVEACEYRANFLKLRPSAAVVLGIEADHFDYYHSWQDLQRAYAQFMELVPPDGHLLIRHECRASRAAAAQARGRVETFGLDPQADWSAQRLRQRAGRYTFEIVRRGQPLVEVSLRVPGRHQVLNALAAAALAFPHGVRPTIIAEALGRFPGLRRRLEWLGSWQDIELWDDYAHHPTEVIATLQAIREMYPGQRLWCVFQPHQASRTAHLLDEFAASLENTDKLLLAEIFRAREGDPQPGEVTVADLARTVRARGVDVPDLHETRAIARLLRHRLMPGDVLVTIGAGDIGDLHRELVLPAGPGSL